MSGSKSVSHNTEGNNSNKLGCSILPGCLFLFAIFLIGGIGMSWALGGGWILGFFSCLLIMVLALPDFSTSFPPSFPSRYYYPRYVHKPDEYWDESEDGWDDFEDDYRQREEDLILEEREWNYWLNSQRYDDW